MEEKIKLVVISHALVQKSTWARWQRLAEKYPVDVTLIVPLKWISYWFEKETVFENSSFTSDNFHVIPIQTSNKSNWCKYYFKSIDAKFKILQPDIVFVVQEPLTYVLTQIMVYRLLWARKAKLIFYSYINIPLNPPSLQGKIYTKMILAIMKSFTDMAVSGSIEASIILKEMGYQKPILVQTEIGIDEFVFCPNEAERNKIRSQLKLNCFVVGFCGRLSKEKGVMDLVEACIELDNDWKLLFVGDGDLRQTITDRLSEVKMANRLVITGQIPHNEIQNYLRAMDVMVLPSRTTPTWKEQFGLVLPQAMACGVAVIGSNSGAIPEVIGNNGLLFNEGDILSLTKHIKRLQVDKIFHLKMIEKGLRLGANKYTASYLAGEFYNWIRPLFK